VKPPHYKIPFDAFYHYYAYGEHSIVA
jgi:hypothetical protein